MSQPNYICFDCGNTMVRVGTSLVCSNSTCGRKWTPKESPTLNHHVGSNHKTKKDKDEILESNDPKYFDETDGYGDDPEMGYYNIHGEMPPPGWGKKNNNDDDELK